MRPERPAILTESTRRQLLRFCSGEIDAEAFEVWVCADEELEGWEPAFLAEILRRKEPYVRSIQRSCADLIDRLQRGYPDDL